MIHTILVGAALSAVTVAVHASGLSLVLRLLKNSHHAPPTRFWPITWLLVRVAWCLILVHVAEIAVWGTFYLRQKCLPDPESAFYFSGITYTTIGYGDLLLPTQWRLLAPIEGLTGILMCGLSAGIFYAVVSRILIPRLMVKRKSS